MGSVLTSILTDPQARDAEAAKKVALASAEAAGPWLD